MKRDKLYTIKSTGFKTPHQYFESIEDNVFSKLTENSAIKPNQSTGFTVPKNYFDTVEDYVLSKISKDNTSVISIKKNGSLYYIAGIAASLLLLVAVIFNGSSNQETLTVDMVQAYFEDIDISSYELAQLLSDSNLLDEDFSIIKTPYEEDNLELYLLEHTDIETLIEY